MIFTTENQLKELGDKLPADKKAPIEAALAETERCSQGSGFGCYRLCDG